MTMTLISTVTVGAGGASTITFTGIPQTGTDLLCFLSARGSGNDNNTALELNGSTTNFNFRTLNGAGGGSPASFSPATNSMQNTQSVNSDTANTFGNTSVLIANYTVNRNKPISVDGSTENNATAAYLNIQAGLWASTSAITSLSILASFAQNSTASLYTITKGSGGATVS